MDSILAFFLSFFSSFSFTPALPTTTATSPPSLLLTSLSKGTTSSMVEQRALTLTASQSTVAINSYVKIKAAGGVAPYTYTLQGKGTLHKLRLGNEDIYYKSGTKTDETIITVKDRKGNSASVPITVAIPLTLTSPLVSIPVTTGYRITPKGGSGAYSYKVLQGKGRVSRTGIFTAPSTPGKTRIRVQDTRGQETVIEVLSIDTTLPTSANPKTLPQPSENPKTVSPSSFTPEPPKILPSPSNPLVSLVATPSSVEYGGKTVLTWSSSLATDCSTSWGDTALFGTYTTPSLTSETTYWINCKNQTGESDQQSLTIMVLGEVPAPTPAPTPIPLPVPTLPPNPTPVPVTYTPSFTGKGYYVDSLFGDDANSGTVDKPWKNLSKAVTTVLNSGDALLLKCGDLWREYLEINATFAPQGNVLIAAYGNCTGTNKPVIYGSNLVTNLPWVIESSFPIPVYKAQLDSKVGALFMNGEPVKKARYPNFTRVGNEYTLIKTTLSENSFTVGDADKTLYADKDLIGSTIYIHTEPWYIDKAIITNYNPTSGEVILDVTPKYTLKATSGYIIENKKWMLDSPNEWFYDELGKTLYMATTGGSNPSSSTVEASIRNTTFTVNNVSNVRLEHLSLRQGIDFNMSVTGASNISIDAIDTKYANETNIRVLNSSNTSIQNSSVIYAGVNGINVRDSPGSLIKNNTIFGIGMNGFPGWTIAGITLASKNTILEGNSISDSAYVGISLRNDQGVKVLNNTINNVCIRLADCGGIYSYGTQGIYPNESGMVIEGNSITGVNKNYDGLTSSQHYSNNGIYLDEHTMFVKVLRNTIRNTPQGIKLHISDFNVISENIISKLEGFAIQGHTSDSVSMRGNIISNNLFTVTGNYLHSWKHPTDYKLLFSGQDPNILSGNGIVLPQNKTTIIWEGMSGSIWKGVTESEWRMYAPTDTFK